MPVYERVFVDIDTQYDFLDLTGKLYVPGAVELHRVLKKLFDYAAELGIPVLSSVDDHPPDAQEFARFGPHCLSGSPGQKKLPITLLGRSIHIALDERLCQGVVALLKDYDQLIFSKDSLNVFTNPHFVELIAALNVGEYVVFGVATDYCVLQEASGLLKMGKRVKIVSDAVKAISEEGGRRAHRELTELGAQWVEAAEVIGCTV